METVITTSQVVGMSDLVEGFMSAGLVGAAESTVRWYRLRLGSLVAAGVGVDCVGADLLRWYAGLPEMSVYTLHGYVRAVRRFFRWLHELGVVSDNPSRLLRFPRLPAVGRKGVSDRDAEAMLAAASDHVRDYALMSFVWVTGCRLAGVASLQVDNLDLDRRRALVVEKFDKGRRVYYDELTAGALSAWLCERDKSVIWVFPGVGGKPIAERSIYDRFGRYAQLAGVVRNWSPHQWRHAFGRRMAEAGMPLGVLSQIMGHSSVDVTVRHYGLFADQELQAAYDRFVFRSPPRT